MPAYKDSKKGTWYAKFRYTDWQGNRKETTKRGFSTKREAKEYEEEYRRKVQGTSDMTLGSLYEIYIADRKQNVKNSTVESINYLARNHILPYLGKLPLSQITPNTVRKWQNKINTTQLAPSTIKLINRRISAILTFAVKYYNLPRNPMQVTGTQGTYERRIDMWTKEEFTKFIDSVDNPIDKTLFLTLYYTGMRIGEALALTRSNIDLESAQIKINKTIAHNGEITEPKTKASIRTIRIPQHIANEIKHLMDVMPYDDDFVFPVKYITLLARYKRYIAKAGVRNLTIHCLRHAHVSNLIAHGVPITAISKRVGHASPKTTLAIYAHAEEDSEKQIADLLEHI